MFVNQARSWHHKFWNQIFLFTQAIFCTWPKSQDKNLNILWTKRASIEANKTIFWKVSVRRGHLAHIQDGQKSPLPKTCHTYSTMMKLGTFITYLKKIQKNMWLTWHTPWFLQTSAFFHWKSATFAISRNTDIDCILIHISSFLNFFWVHRNCFNKYD